MTSRNPQFDFGPARELHAESVGPAGQRYFRLHTEADEVSAYLWMEKEQLYELAVAIKQMLKTQVRDVPLGPTINVNADHEFKVASLALGHDQEQDRYMLLANVLDDTTVAVWAERDQLDRFADQAMAVCAAGRPRCPFCRRPMNEGEEHVCPRSNGHHDLTSS